MRESDNNADDPAVKEAESLKESAIKFKAFRHTFSERDLRVGLDDKNLVKKLKTTENLEQSYHDYLRELERDPLHPAVFPWDSPFRRFVFFVVMKVPRFLKWSAILLLLLAAINSTPGPTRHMVEFILARAIYDTTSISRLPESLESYAHSAKIVDAGGKAIKSYGRRSVTASIPDKVKSALLACEDHYLLPHPQNPWYVNAFLVHAGVSWVNLAGAVKDTIQGQTRGASTIVMQNAKKILRNNARTIANKLEEIIVSYMLVAQFGKDKNLDFYINTVPVGNNIYGFPEAARVYFKKELSELNAQQLVTIGSFIPNHNRQIALYEIWQGRQFDDLSPEMRAHAVAAVEKVNSALAHLARQGVISVEQLKGWRLSDEESIRRIGFRKYHSPLYGEEEWTSWNVIKEVLARKYVVKGRTITGEQLMLEEEGDVVVETEVNLELVDIIKQSVQGFLADPAFRKMLSEANRSSWRQDLELYMARRIPPPYTSFEEFMDYLYRHINVGVVMISRQGRILAYVGGKVFLQESGDEVRAENDEQAETPPQKVIIDLMSRKATVAPSSTIKPVVAYYTMLTTDSTLQTTYSDRPLEYKYVESEGGKIWLPRNWFRYDAPGSGQNRFLGRNYTLMEAQVISINTIFARLYTETAIRSAMLDGFDRIGLDYNKEDAKHWPFGIGASNVPVQQWLGLYNAFLDGYYREPSFVRRITVNNESVFDAAENQDRPPVLLFDAVKEREAELEALYEICNTGSGATMKTEFPMYRNLASGKTGTAPSGRTSLFITHFNPYRDRARHQDATTTMIVILTTNTGGHKSVGLSTNGPTKVTGRIYDTLFRRELQARMAEKIQEAKDNNAHFRNNHLFLANVNRYMEQLMNGKCGAGLIRDSIIGVDGYVEALEQILNSTTRIYEGDDRLFQQLVGYYCDQAKLVR